MEGNERANVEARIKCLRNIQVLLDAAVMEMQQYSSVVSQLDASSRRSNPTANSTNAAAAAAETSEAPKSNETVQDGASASSSKSSETAKPLPTPETGARPKVKSQDKKEDTVSPESDKSDDQDEVRKRRLEKFGSPIKDSD